MNRHSSQEQRVEVELRGLGSRQLVSATQLHHSDLKLANTKDAPDAVAPQALRDVTIDGERLTLTLQPLSWNVVATALVA